MKTAIAALLLACLPLSVRAGESSFVATYLTVAGDDGLTQRFAASLELSLSESKFFEAPTTSKNGLILEIPSHLYWQEAQGTINFQYVVIFTDKSSKYLGVSIGSCWEKSMARCANKVVSEARKAWLRSR